jgi:HK97 family phage prohead protease
VIAALAYYRPAAPACDSLRFAGYAALFGRPDSGGDIIVRGAFRRSLDARRRAGEAMPVLWQHRPGQQIGWIEHAAEDSRGLRVIGRIAHAEGTRAILLKDREVTGLSFGYRATSFRPIVLAGGNPGRELAEVDIFEVSLVTDPMQPGARVHLVV